MLWTNVPAIQSVLKPYVDVRERYERRLNRDFNSSVNDNRTDLLSRWRVGATMQINKGLSAEAQYQFSFGTAWIPTRILLSENSDLSLGYLDYKQKGNELIIGRQKIVLGNQRLIGPSEWLNVPRSFDGLRVKTHGFDLWTAKIDVGLPKPRYSKLAAASYQSKIGLTSLIYKHDEPKITSEDVYTLDELYTKSTGKWDIDLEGALQIGANAGKRQQAYAGHAQGRYRFNARASVYGEANYASGGGDANSSHTFDNLYPTNHDKYGAMDMQTWSNMQELALGLEYKPCAKAGLKLSWHRFQLADASDAWYGASGVPNQFAPSKIFRDPSGNSGRDTGQEIDFEATWVPNKNILVLAGVASFRPGSFVRNVSGHADTQTWGYLSAQGRF